MTKPALGRARVARSVSVYSLFRSFWNYEYRKLPCSTDLLKLIGELHKWHVGNGSLRRRDHDFAGSKVIMVNTVSSCAFSDCVSTIRR